MARILPLYALLVVAIMKSTAATTTAEGTTEVTTITGTGTDATTTLDTDPTMGPTTDPTIELMTDPTTDPLQTGLSTDLVTDPTTDLLQTGISTDLVTDPTTDLLQTGISTDLVTDPTTDMLQTGISTDLVTDPTTDLLQTGISTDLVTDPTTDLLQTGISTDLVTDPTTDLLQTGISTDLVTDPTTDLLQTGISTDLVTDPTTDLLQTGLSTELMTDPTTDLLQTGLSTDLVTDPTTDLLQTGLSTDLVTDPTTYPLQTGLSTELTSEPKTEPKTTPPTEPPTKPSTEEPPRVGPVPEPTLPDIDGDANKTYQFEFAVKEATPEGCTSDNLTSPACDTFMYNVTQELEAVYGESDAFESVEVVLILRNGTLIVSHTVTYSYNEMSDEERMASAQDIYDDTLGSAVADGNLGDYTVQEDCGSCAPPAETSSISSRTAKCPSEYSEPAFKTNYWVCESICFTNRDYCNLHGFCWQRGNLYSQPICSCDWDNGEWYWGYRCQYYMNQMHLIIGCSCGAAVLLVLLVCIIAYCVVTPKAISDKDSQSSESVIDVFLPPIDDTKDGNTLQGNRPDTYIYSGKLGAGSTNVESSSFIGNQNGGPQRESRPEVNEDAAKRQSNGSADNRHSPLMKPNGSSQQRNPEFWGNLNEPSAEHIKLEPFLDHNDSYKIQRPHISGHYNYSNTEPDPYQIMDIPEPDYAQR